MVFIGSVIRLVALCVSIGFFVVEARAFFDCLGHKNDDFLRACKRTRKFWLLITGAAGIVGLLPLLSTAVRMGLVPRYFVPFSGLGALNLLSIIAVVAAGVYLADVKPALPSKV